MPHLSGQIEREPVRPLPPAVVERIAAGEVVERPASVVRELIENALDAQATAIGVELHGGGLHSIRVVDDGWGIPAGDLELAVTAHATSKIRTLDDFARLSTLGFRGEALSSIAALSDLRLCSAADSSGIASAITVCDGIVSSRGGEARSRGTTVTVHDLFADVPARRAVLRSVAAEAAQVLATVRDYALTHASVRFTLLSDDRLLLSTPGTGGAAAVAAIYGADLAHTLSHVSAQQVAGATVAGWVAARAFTQRDARHVVVCVNGRPVSNTLLAGLVQAGYRPLLRKGRHPIALLTIETPPVNLDANVHPAKRHVLLRDERAIGAALRDAVHAALGTRAAESPPAVSALTHTYQHLRQPAFPTRRPRHTLHEPHPLFVPHGAAASTLTMPADALTDVTVLGQLNDSLIVAQSPSGDLLLVDQHRANERLLYEALCRQAAPLHAYGPRADSGDVLTASRGQMLLEPLVVELTTRQAAILTHRLDELASLGLVCEPFGGATFLVRALPTLPKTSTPPAAFISDLTADAAIDADDWLEHVRTSLACRAALRRGQPLSNDEQRTLLRDLALANAPAVCPHGSPIVVRWPREQLARTFEW
jgi:DNA mismatch repair protein MutL